MQKFFVDKECDMYLEDKILETMEKPLTDEQKLCEIKLAAVLQKQKRKNCKPNEKTGYKKLVSPYSD